MQKSILGEKMKGNVLYEVINNVAVLTVDNPPVNPLSEGVRNGAYEGIVKAEADPDVKAIVITGKGRAFIAGADISEFGGAGEGLNFFSGLAFGPKTTAARGMSSDTCFSSGTGGMRMALNRSRPMLSSGAKKSG